MPFCYQNRLRYFFARKIRQHPLEVESTWRRATQYAWVLSCNCSRQQAGLQNIVMACYPWSPKESLDSIAPRTAADPGLIPDSSWGCFWSSEAPFCSLNRLRYFFARKIRQHPLGVQPTWRRAIQYAEDHPCMCARRQAGLRKRLTAHLSLLPQ